MQLEKHINVKFPEYQAKFYSNRQNLYIHMGLDQSLFSFENFRKPLQEIDCFLNEHLENKLTSVYPPKFINSTKWKHGCIISKKMAESNELTCQMNNVFIPKYVPDNLKWYEKDGLETWYRKNKCEEFLSDTDAHFKNRKNINLDMIKKISAISYN